MVMKKFVVVFFIVVIITCNISADALATLYTSTDPIVTWVERILLQQGYSLLPTVSPYSGYQLLQKLHTISTTSLSYEDKKNYDIIEQKLLNYSYNNESPKFAYDAGLRLSPELYIHSNDSELLTEREWFFNQKARADMASLYGQAIYGNHVYGVFDYGIRKTRGWRSATKELSFTGTFNTNITFEDEFIERASPYKAYLGFANEWMTFSIGRATLSIGRGNTGNLLLGNHLDYHDYLHLSLHSEAVNYSMNAIHFNTIDPDKKIALTTSFRTGIRLFATHTLEFDILKRVKLSITDSVLFYASHLDIRMFNPLMFYHNYYNLDPDINPDLPREFNEVNKLMQLAPSATLPHSILIYGQWAIDQIQTVNEQDPTDTPNAFGCMLGLEFSKSIAAGSFYGFIEGVYTSPYLYLIGDEEYVEFPKTGWNLSLVGAMNVPPPWKSSGLGYIGYVHGPDSIVAACRIGYEKIDSYDVHFDIHFGMHGENGLEAFKKISQTLDIIGSNEYDRFSPSGIVEYRLAAGIGTSWILIRNLKVHSQLHYLHRWNFRNIAHQTFEDFQFVLGVSYTLKVL